MFLPGRSIICAIFFLFPSNNAIEAQQQRLGLPQDWTHRQVVFSMPQTPSAAAALAADPRYQLQAIRRSFVMRLPDDSQVIESTIRLPARHRDWGQAMNNASVNEVLLYPAKYTFNTSNPTPDCTNDYVVFTLNSSSSTAFNVVGFNNLYVNSGGTGLCSGKTAPTPLFAYAASRSGGAIGSSPTLSLDGTQIAFLEASSPANFIVLKWKSGNVTASSWPAPFNSSNLSNCASSGPPCEYSVALSNSTNSPQSAFIDYTSDTAYATDGQGFVYAISPVFGGGQPVVKWSLKVGQQNPYTSPVYDSVSKNVFIADGLVKAYYVRTTSTSTGSCSSGSPPCVGSSSPSLSTQPGTLTNVPIVDSSTGKVLFQSANDGTHSAIGQFSTVLTSQRIVTIGSATSQIVGTGTFDNKYFTSTATGKFYACGVGSNNDPQLYAAGFDSSGNLLTTTAGGPLALTSPPQATPCSPLTEVFNITNAKDWLFVGVGTSCSSSIHGGCIQSFNITSAFPTAPTAQVAEASGVSGIIVDNVQSSSATATNVYFITVGGQSCTTYAGGTGTGNCAVKLTQNGLQ